MHLGLQKRQQMQVFRPFRWIMTKYMIELPEAPEAIADECQ